jgi:hypothetical protein
MMVGSEEPYSGDLARSSYGGGGSGYGGGGYLQVRHKDDLQNQRSIFNIQIYPGSLFLDDLLRVFQTLSLYCISGEAYNKGRKLCQPLAPVPEKLTYYKDRDGSTCERLYRGYELWFIFFKIKNILFRLS